MSQDWPAKCTGTTILGSKPSRIGLFELGGERVGTHVAGAQIDVDEIDLRAAVEAAIRRSGECVRRGPQPVTRSEPQRHAGDVQRRGGAVDGDRVFGAAKLGQRRLEPRHRRPLGEPVGAQDRCDRFDILRADILPAIGNVRHGQIIPWPCDWPRSRRAASRPTSIRCWCRTCRRNPAATLPAALDAGLVAPCS